MPQRINLKTSKQDNNLSDKHNSKKRQHDKIIGFSIIVLTTIFSVFGFWFLINSIKKDATNNTNRQQATKIINNIPDLQQDESDEQETEEIKEDYKDVSLGNGYKIVNDSLYFRDKKIEKADPYSFTPLNNYYQKDNNYVFYLKEAIEGSDSESFKIIERGCYAQDKNNIYYLKHARNSKPTLIIIKNIDFNTLEFLKIPLPNMGYYFKDKNNVYMGDMTIIGADPKTFEFIHYNYAKDINNIYYLGEASNKILTNDLDNFEIVGFKLNTSYSIDSFFVYYDGEKIEKSDPNTFRPYYEDGFCLDDNYVYYQGKIQKNSDSQTFEIIYNNSSNYYRDKNNVYYLDNKTLELKIITDQEPYSFSHLLNMKKQSQDYNYIKNNQHVYYRGLKIEDADPETFLIMTDIIDGKGCCVYMNDCPYGKDKENIYFRGENINALNINNFDCTQTQN
ncbi:DKNYY domain-containing protein [Candidatus Parcubacteria bacterium]|nr:DKNYY domain-containing protein [Candidatus Parcubacteria bacterium]